MKLVLRKIFYFDAPVDFVGRRYTNASPQHPLQFLYSRLNVRVLRRLLGVSRFWSLGFCNLSY